MNTTHPQPAPLTKAQRKQLIVKEINLNGKATFEHLALIINVSEDTIRRDINELEKENLVIRVKGGAMAKGDLRTTDKQADTGAEQTAIAEKLLSLLEKDMLLLLGGGPIIREFIQLIPYDLKLTIVTANILTASELLAKPNIRTIILGGQLSTYSQMSAGADLFKQLSQFNANLCILSANALDLQGGFSDADWDTVQVKQAMLAASQKTAIVIHSAKLNKTLQIKVANLSALNMIVTELSADSALLSPYKSAAPNLNFL